MENDVLMFYGEIVKNRPDLVVIGKGDPYQQLKVLLRGYVLDL